MTVYMNLMKEILPIIL